MGNRKVKPIRTEKDLEAALVRIEELMDAEPGTEESEELDLLADLVELYESKHVQIGWPGPIAAIEYYMDQGKLSPRDLIPYIGSRAKVSEVLSGKREITMSMARALHEHLGIPADVLLQPAETTDDDPFVGLDWSRFPIKAMEERGWLHGKSDVLDSPEDLILDLINRTGGKEVAGAIHYHKNNRTRANAKMDPYALKAWCWHVLAEARKNRPKTPYKYGTITLDFLKTVARLSRSETGPLQAMDFLAEHGIALVIAEHLPKTYLDGATLRLGDGRPVIGLSLRYDRIDNFWFCLLHELAHVGRHLDITEPTVFIDDMSLRNNLGFERDDPREKEADDWAEEALLPLGAWNSWHAKAHPTSMEVLNLASSLEIHPAIVANRVRQENQNHRLLSHFVGTGEVRRLFHH